MHSRAGLVALVLILIFSIVSAVPIPVQVTESGLSSALPPAPPPSFNGKDHNQLDNLRISEISLSGRMSTLPAATRVLTRRRRYITADMDDEQLVRRNIFDNIKHAFQNFGNKVKDGFQKAGSAIKQGFQKAGGAIKKGFQKVGEGIKTVAQKVKTGVVSVAQKIKTGVVSAAQKIKTGVVSAAQKIKTGVVTAAKKVGHFMKTTGATVAKFGLKVVESVGEVVGHVATFIPEIGKPIQQAIHGISKVAGVVSDHIHANLSPQLEKGMDVMDKADTIMGYLPRRRDLSEEEEIFQQRDYGEAY